MKAKPKKSTQVRRMLAVFVFIIIVLLANWNTLKNAKKKPVQLNINFDSPPEAKENWDEFGLVNRITPEQLRTYPGYEQISDEEAGPIINVLYWFSIIGVNVYKTQTDQSIFIIE
jgi:hypothetical protein